MGHQVETPYPHFQQKTISPLFQQGSVFAQCYQATIIGKISKTSRRGTEQAASQSTHLMKVVFFFFYQNLYRCSDVVS